jgi:hypothetical protein
LTSRALKEEDHPVRSRARLGLLVLALVATTILGAAPAVAGGHHRFHKAHGRWTNPVGSCVDHLQLIGTGGDFRCTGTSHWTGTFAGDTTWRVRGHQDPATMDIAGRIRERFVGESRRGDHGRLRFVEHFTQSAAGHIVIHGHVVAARRGLKGTRARITWSGSSSAATGEGSGRYHGRWRPAP